MRLDNIHIRNFRGFEDLVVDLNPQFNLVIGDNGAGKTSFLDACSGILQTFIEEVTSPDRISVKSLNNYDIRIKTIDGQPRLQFPHIVDAKGIVNDKYLNWYLYAEEASELKFEYPIENLKELVKKMVVKSRSGDKVVFPLLSYYTTARLLYLYKEEHIGQDVEYFRQIEGIIAGYERHVSAHTNSRTFLSWYKTYEDEIRKFDKKEDKIFLNVFNSTISSFVKEWTDMAYSFKTDELIGFMTNENGEKQYLSFNQLSDGYRNVIGMVADMVYRCIQLNPHLKENVVKETEGVVLIDELDLHLHPNWQRRIVADLKRVFPKIQFIATSHSPFIIQSLKKEELINLDNNNTKPEEDPFKQSIEDVAEDIMQVEGMPRSNEFNEMIKVAEEYYGLLKQGKNGTEVANLRQRLTQLEARYSNDAAFVALLKAERETKKL